MSYHIKPESPGIKLVHINMLLISTKCKKTSMFCTYTIPHCAPSCAPFVNPFFHIVIAPPLQDKLVTGYCCITFCRFLVIDRLHIKQEHVNLIIYFIAKRIQPRFAHLFQEIMFLWLNILLCLNCFASATTTEKDDLLEYEPEDLKVDMFSLLQSSIQNEIKQPPHHLTDKQLEWWKSLGDLNEERKQPHLRKEYRELTYEEQRR